MTRSMLNIGFYVLLLSVAFARIPAALGSESAGSECGTVGDDVDSAGSPNALLCF
ncbi:hypothetical protein BDR04DRAFT_1102828 [Suillus decipiens]|nr:hypothetical protein BDR04DRAFT_1102828 [Suillus decipiens]